MADLPALDVPLRNMIFPGAGFIDAE